MFVTLNMARIHNDMDNNPRHLQQRIARAIQSQKGSSALERQYVITIRQLAEASKLARDIKRLSVRK